MVREVYGRNLSVAELELTEKIRMLKEEAPRSYRQDSIGLGLPYPKFAEI